MIKYIFLILACFLGGCSDPANLLDNPRHVGGIIIQQTEPDSSITSTLRQNMNGRIIDVTLINDRDFKGQIYRIDNTYVYLCMNSINDVQDAVAIPLNQVENVSYYDPNNFEP